MYADVILPLPLSDLFTYAVPVEMKNQIGVGYRVIVPFGSKRHYTAIVKKLHSKTPEKFEIKEIHSLVDSHPVVTENQLNLWEWISFYYLSPLGDVYNAAIPSFLKSDNLNQKFKPKTKTYYRINSGIKVETARDIIGRAKKQQALYDEINYYLKAERVDSLSREKMIDLKNYSAAVVNGLVKKEIIVSFKKEIGRIESEEKPTRNPYPLSNHQQQAYNSIIDFFKTRQTTLLHGVTSSGKTEIYIHLIDKLLREGKQTLYLVPEIALSTQLTDRLKDVFGNKLGVYHSLINDNDRVEIWQKMLSDNPYKIILGVRSSIFLPFQNLGLVIVDEEHEVSYKQQDPAPRYHARDTAIMLSGIHNAKTLLGSATPSLESYYNAENGKYGLITLNERYNEIKMPSILIENIYELKKRRKMKTLLAPALIEHINTALNKGEQVILFRNRRGFATLVECNNCAWTPKCKRCDVALTYHKNKNRLICHYCNASYPFPSECPSCSSDNLLLLGQGTEQLEEEVCRLFPDSKVSRMDTDSTRGKNAYNDILSSFRNNDTDILIGTQMLSKGLDFENVSVVGIIAADSLLNYPDFRSNERGFQLMLQAAGRAGRKKSQGTVIIQSSDPELPVYKFLMAHDYKSFFAEELTERKLFRYPPFYRLIRLVFKHKNASLVEKASSIVADELRTSLKERVLGPNKGVVSRIQSYYYQEVLLKLEAGVSLQKVRYILKSAENNLRARQMFKYIILYYDVDPL